MEITIDYINKAFDKYNEKYFGDSLNKPTFKLFKSKRTLGQFCVQNSHYRYFGGQPTLVIRISNYYNREQKDFDNTIIHEMIHLWVFQNNLKDVSSHGRHWLKMASIINQDGWDIQPTSNEHYECAVIKNKEYTILSFIDKNNKRFICRVNPNKENKFIETLTYNHYQSIHIIRSKNSRKFDTFINCQSNIRGKYITQKEWEDYCNGEKVYKVLK